MAAWCTQGRRVHLVLRSLLHLSNPFTRPSIYTTPQTSIRPAPVQGADQGGLCQGTPSFPLSSLSPKPPTHSPPNPRHQANVDYGKFKDVDNTCSDQIQSPTALRAEFAKRLFLTEEAQLQEALTTARVTAGNEILMAEKEAQTAVRELERVIAEFEGKVEKEVELIEEEIEEEVQKVVPTSLWKQNNAQKLDSLSQKLQSRPLADPRPTPK